METGKREKLKDHIKNKIEDIKKDIKSYQLNSQPESDLCVQCAEAMGGPERY